MHACYRCEKTAFYEILVAVEATLLAQIILTLRSDFFGIDGFMLITAEQNRIYAVTRKSRMIASCFAVITVLQFILGLYLSSHAATKGCEPVTKRCQLFLPTSMFQPYSSHRSRFRFTWYATY